jgi:alkyldihydroxyacetonephosphate synthase
LPTAPRRCARWPSRACAPPAPSAADAWRAAFLQAPYFRDTVVACGILYETFETAVTWDRYTAFHAALTGAVEEALGGAGRVTCRFTHV